jgi:hypothetical protein
MSDKDTQRWVDEVCHYRNLAIEFGAPPNRMLGKYDRELAERGVDDSWGDANRDQTPELWEQLEKAEAERDALRAELAKTRLERDSLRGDLIDAPEKPP